MHSLRLVSSCLQSGAAINNYKVESVIRVRAVGVIPFTSRTRFNGCKEPCSLPTANVKRAMVKLRIAAGSREAAQSNLAEQADQVFPGFPSSEAEEARRELRKVYDLLEWQKYRSIRRWTTILSTVPRSKLTAVWPAVQWAIGVATAVTLYMEFHHAGMLPDWLPSFAQNHGSDVFLQFTTAETLRLLFFRTKTAYARWDEANKMWYTFLVRCEDFMRQACAAMPDQPEARREVRRWLVVLACAMHVQFQSEELLEEQLQDILTEKELQWFMERDHKAVAAINVLSQLVETVPMDLRFRLKLSQGLTYFHDVLGGCERLVRAPIPLLFSDNCSGFFSWWVTILPCALYGSCHLATVPVAASVVAIIKATDVIGTQIEEPFGVLTLRHISDKISEVTLAIVEEDEEIRLMTKELLQSKKRVDTVQLGSVVADDWNF